MESLKPINGISESISGHASLDAEIFRRSYFKLLSHKKNDLEDNKEDSETKSEVSREISENNSSLRHTYAEFEVNRETHEVVVRIIDADSGKLVRTIPPDQLAEEIVKGDIMPNRLRRRAVLV